MQCYSLTHTQLLNSPGVSIHLVQGQRHPHITFKQTFMNLTCITQPSACHLGHNYRQTSSTGTPLQNKENDPSPKKIFMFLYWSKIPDVYSDVFTKQSPVQKLHTIHLDRFWLHFAYWWSSSIYKVLYIRKLWIWPGCPLIISEKVAFHFSSILQH